MKIRGTFLVAAFLLAGCSPAAQDTGVGGSGGFGGGGGPSPSFQFGSGAGGSGGVVGDIDGFGSILINGLTLETDDAEFYIEGVSGFSQDDLREGFYVVIVGDLDEDEADEVFYRSNLRGPVSATPVAVDAAAGIYELTVLGQTVVTSASTLFQGVLVEDIVESDLLEVSGPIDGAGRVLATYVGLETALAEYKAIGAVSDLDSSTATFTLGGLSVAYSGATLVDFDGASLTNGQLVEVRLAPGDFTAPASATVGAVELLPEPEIEEGAEVELAGLITSFSSATSFSVNGLSVTTTASTVFEDGDIGQLAAGVSIELEGTANASGVIVAEEIEFLDDALVRVEGVVTDVDVTAGTVTALGVTFEVRASTELEDDEGDVEPFTLANLMNGDYVEIRGFPSGSAVVAVELERESADTEAKLRGPLTGFDQVAETVEIQGVAVRELLGTTRYVDLDNETVTRSEFFALLAAGLSEGRSVQADWDDFGSLADPADTLRLAAEDD